jgi:cell division protein FtsQ
MPARPGILIPRSPAGFTRDLAERTPFTTRQRVRRRSRTKLRQAGQILRRVGITVGLGMLALGLVAVGRLLVASPIFLVRSVEVTGLARMAEAEARAASGIVPGTHLFSIDPDRVREKLEALPQVKRASVIREFPNRVTIVVEERTPFALAQAGGLVWIDEEGAVLDDQPRPVVQPLPLVSGLSAEELTPGRRVPSDRLRAALQLLRAILRTSGGLVSEISEVNVARPEAPLLYTLEGVEVKLGSEAWAERLARLEGLLAQLRNQREPLASVDLRFENVVVLAPKGGK